MVVEPATVQEAETGEVPATWRDEHVVRLAGGTGGRRRPGRHPVRGAGGPRGRPRGAGAGSARRARARRRQHHRRGPRRRHRPRYRQVRRPAHRQGRGAGPLGAGRAGPLHHRGRPPGATPDRLDRRRVPARGPRPRPRGPRPAGPEPGRGGGADLHAVRRVGLAAGRRPRPRPAGRPSRLLDLVGSLRSRLADASEEVRAVTPAGLRALAGLLAEAGRRRHRRRPPPPRRRLRAHLRPGLRAPARPPPRLRRHGGHGHAWP